MNFLRKKQRELLEGPDMNRKCETITKNIIHNCGYTNRFSETFQLDFFIRICTSISDFFSKTSPFICFPKNKSHNIPRTLRSNYMHEVVNQPHFIFRTASSIRQENRTYICSDLVILSRTLVVKCAYLIESGSEFTWGTFWWGDVSYELL